MKLRIFSAPLNRETHTPPNSFCRWSMPNCEGWRRKSSHTRRPAKLWKPQDWFTKPIFDCLAATEMDTRNIGTAARSLLCCRGRSHAANLDRKRRRKRRDKHGGGRRQVDLIDDDLAIRDAPDDLLALDEALTRLTSEDATAAELVKLRVFTGLSIEQAGEVLSFSRATAYRQWKYARAWLRCEIEGKSDATGIRESSRIS